MKKFFTILFSIIILVACAYYFLPKKVNPVKNGQIVLQPAKITDYDTVQTKLAGARDFPIYRNVSKKGGINVISSTKYFKKGLLQSQHSAKTEHGTYWQLVVNGRNVGWVSEKFFRRNEISVAKNISLVRNRYYSFPTRDAIAYAVNSHGALISPSRVRVSQTELSSANPGTFAVKFSYGKLSKVAYINVRDNANEGVSVANKLGTPGPSEANAFTGSSQSSSPNWNPENSYQPETQVNSYSGSHNATMRTAFYQPRFHLLSYDQEYNQLNQVGVIPQGINLFNNELTVSYFSQPNATWGHLVTYNLNQLTNPTQTQNLLNMSFEDFKQTSQNIAVSPYLKLGHGQSLGVTKNYIYVLANSNAEVNPAKSEEILQISRKNYQIKNLWTIKVWNRSEYYPRYFHNAYFVNSHLMYAVFHNATKATYEYWRLSHQGNTWTPTEVSATQSNFVKNNSPLQGFTYANGNFYLAFNDNVFAVNAESGRVLKHYHFHTLRESEGIAVKNGTPYVELARRPELLEIK